MSQSTTSPSPESRKPRRQTRQVMLINAGGMALGLLAHALVARRLGVSAVMDALVVAWVLPRLVGTVARDATKFSVVTLLVGACEQSSAGDLRLARGLMNVMGLVGLVVVLVLGLGSAVWVKVVGPGLGEVGWEQAAWLLWWSLPMAWCGLVAAVPEALLNSRGKHRAAAWRGCAMGGLALAGIAWSWGVDDAWQAAWRIAVGYAAGWAVALGWLWWAAAKQAGLGWSARAWLGRDDWAQLRGAVGIPAAGFGLRQIARAASQAIVSLGPEGAVGAYFLAMRLLGAVQNVVGVTLAVTGQPKLAKTDLSGESDAFQRALWRRVRIALWISVPMALGVMVLHRPVVYVVFGVGSETFGEEAVRVTAGILMVLMVSLPMYCLSPILNSGLYAQKRWSAVWWNMLLASSVTVGSGWLLFAGGGGWDGLGVVGVAWGVVLGAWVSVLNLAWQVRRGARQA